MKFVKVIIDGKEYYRRIDDESAEKNDAADACPEIIDAEIENAEEPSSGERFKRDTAEFFEKVGNGAKDLGEKFVVGMKNLGEKINEGAREINAKLKEGTERLFNKDKSTDPESCEAKLLRLLPYMSKEDTHGVCVKLLENPNSVKDINVSSIMPFLSEDDCDAIFSRCIEVGNTNCDIETCIPYVSKQCLTKIVDNYIEGRYPELNIDALYPFLSDADIKRIFYHIVENA